MLPDPQALTCAPLFIKIWIWMLPGLQALTCAPLFIKDQGVIVKPSVFLMFSSPNCLTLRRLYSSTQWLTMRAWTLCWYRRWSALTGVCWGICVGVHVGGFVCVCVRRLNWSTQWLTMISWTLCWHRRCSASDCSGSISKLKTFWNSRNIGLYFYKFVHFGFFKKLKCCPTNLSKMCLFQTAADRQVQPPEPPEGHQGAGGHVLWPWVCGHGLDLEQAAGPVGQAVLPLPQTSGRLHCWLHRWGLLTSAFSFSFFSSQNKQTGFLNRLDYFYLKNK